MGISIPLQNCSEIFCFHVLLLVIVHASERSRRPHLLSHGLLGWRTSAGSGLYGWASCIDADIILVVSRNGSFPSPSCSMVNLMVARTKAIKVAKGTTPTGK